MGTGKSGHLDNYSDNIPGRGKGKKPDEEDNKCNQALSAQLEDFERSDYYFQQNSVPDVGTQVLLVFDKRLIVEVDGLSIGFLPTRYNYLVPCIKNGFSYQGRIVSATSSPMFRIQVDLAPA